MGKINDLITNIFLLPPSYSHSILVNQNNLFCNKVVVNSSRCLRASTPSEFGPSESENKEEKSKKGSIHVLGNKGEILNVLCSTIFILFCQISTCPPVSFKCLLGLPRFLTPCAK